MVKFKLVILIKLLLQENMNAPLERVVSIVRAVKKSISESFIIKSTYNWKGLATALKMCLCPL